MQNMEENNSSILFALINKKHKPLSVSRMNPQDTPLSSTEVSKTNA